MWTDADDRSMMLILTLTMTTRMMIMMLMIICEREWPLRRMEHRVRFSCAGGQLYRQQVWRVQGAMEVTTGVPPSPPSSFRARCLFCQCMRPPRPSSFSHSLWDGHFPRQHTGSCTNSNSKEKRL